MLCLDQRGKYLRMRHMERDFFSLQLYLWCVQALATSTQWGLKYLTNHIEHCPGTAHAYRDTRQRVRKEVSSLYWCFDANLSWIEFERDIERDGRTGAFTYQTSLLFIIELQLCADRQPLFKQTPPFDSVLTWRHTGWMSPNIFSSSLYMHSRSALSSRSLVQTQTLEKGLGMSVGSVKNVSKILAW